MFGCNGWLLYPAHSFSFVLSLNLYIKTQSLGLLMGLAASERQSRDKMMSAGCVTSVLNAMQAFPEDVDLQVVMHATVH